MTRNLSLTTCLLLVSSTWINILLSTSAATISITSPAEGDLFAVGDYLTLTAEAYEDNGATVKDSNIFWEVDFCTEESSCSKLLSMSPGKEVMFGPAPQPSDFLSLGTSFMEITLTYANNGTTMSVSRRIMPKTVNVTFFTVPSTTYVEVFGGFRVSPNAGVEFWENQIVDIDAPDQDGYFFDRWFPGGPQSRNVTISSTGTTNFTAYFVPVDTSASPSSLLALDVSDQPSMGPSARVVAVTDGATFVPDEDPDAPQPEETQETTDVVPRLFITSPSANTKYSVGDTLTVRGYAIDGDGEIIEDMMMVWDLFIHDDEETFRMFLPTTTGNNIKVGPIPAVANIGFSETSYVRIQMRIVDPVHGLLADEDAATLNIYPNLVDLSFDVVPDGLFILLDNGNNMVLPPATMTVVENHEFDVYAPDQSGYMFRRWSDDGDQRHNITASSTGLTSYMAFFVLSMPSAIPSDMPSAFDERSDPPSDVPSFIPSQEPTPAPSSIAITDGAISLETDETQQQGGGDEGQRDIADVTASEAVETITRKGMMMMLLVTTVGVRMMT